ncbi:hypothetical protein ASG59_19330 [Methylobacterium sp. Leaf466]|nr:hypothetical protein ASG59_19330 [Methylobacterium sp. Leaf466]
MSRDAASNDVVAALEAPSLEFLTERDAASEPLLPTYFGKATMVVEQALSRRSSIRDERTGAQVAAHGVAGQSGPVRDRQDRQALCLKMQDVVEALTAVLAPLRQRRRLDGHG